MRNALRLLQKGSPLHALYNYIAPNAILNSGGRANEVRCHPGTRKKVIRLIEHWMNAPNNVHSRIMWLSGPAGSGKTAIMQSVAERCENRGIPNANFFFFRTDPSWKSASSLVATLIYQIFKIYPATREIVETALSDNPLMLNGPFEEQLSTLLVEPLKQVSHIPVILLIDGLDECDSRSKHDQRRILHALDNILVQKSCPFRVLVASRVEHQISMAFNQIYTSALPLYLDDRYSPDTDIRLFVVDQFKQVKRTHPLAYQLHSTWPSVKDIENIVKKSSGQFIYASTIMHFISTSPASPQLSLDRVHSVAPISTRSPFSQLDAVYTYILSQADDQEALKDIIHTDLLIKATLRWRTNVDFYDRSPTLDRAIAMHKPTLSADVLHSCLSYLMPIARFEHGQLCFYHAWLTDYFLDESRSGPYFVDIDAFSASVFPAIWERIGREYSGKQISSNNLKNIQTACSTTSSPFLSKQSQTRNSWPLGRDFDNAAITAQNRNSEMVDENHF